MLTSVNIFDVCCLFFPFPEHHSSFALFWTRFLFLTLLLSLRAIGYSSAIGIFFKNELFLNSSTLEKELKSEKEQRQTLQKELHQEKDATTLLKTELQQMEGLKKVCTISAIQNN